MAITAPTPPLSDALAKNEAATAEVKKAAEQLAVIHAVLDTQGVKPTNHEDVAQAIAETQEVEKRLDHTAEKLDGVNDTLRHEVQARK